MSSRMDRDEHLRQILTTRDLTLYRASQQSAEIFGRVSRFYIPHNFYSNVADPSFIPTIQQMFALSRITNYRLYDWLAVFGFDLDHIFRLQLLISRQRTTLLDSSIYDVQAWIPWFVDRPNQAPVPPIAPLGQLLAPARPKLAAELLALNKRTFLYCKVGEGDVHAFPHFAPGSIVRIDERRSGELPSEGHNNSKSRLFLIEHGSGFTCSQLLVLDKDRIILYSSERPYEQLELKLGREARILGVVDAEIRSLAGHRRVDMPHRAIGLPRPSPLYSPQLQTNLRDLLRSSRLRAGLSFREASSMSRWIASRLADQLYFVAPSTLSDYETLSVPPRHIQKIVTLCILYCIEFQKFLRACGLPLDQDGREPMPDGLVPRQPPNRSHDLHAQNGQENVPERGGFLDSLLSQWGEVPLFLGHSRNAITGLKNLSLSDVFWVGGDKAPMHPLLINATFVVINRRLKSLVQSKIAGEPPLCLLLKRDGSYLCGCCDLQQGNIVVRAYPGGRLVAQQFRNGIDAEITGQVTTILRRIH